MSTFEVKDNADKVTILLDGNTGGISAGGQGQAGNLVLSDASGNVQVSLKTGGLFPGLILYTPDGKQKFSVHSLPCHLNIGGNGLGGEIFLHPAQSVYSSVFQLGNGANNSTPTISLNGNNGQLALNKGAITIIVFDPSRGNIRVGGAGTGGDIALYPEAAGQSGVDHDLQDFNKASIQLNGNNGRIVLRRQKQDGLFWDPVDSIVLDPELGNIRVGGPGGAAGNIALYPDNTNADDLQDFRKANIHLNGQAGDIFLKNADCAEEFDIVENNDVEPGTVMVLAQAGQLQPSHEAYDKKVVGVISGAGAYKPAIVLDKQHSQNRRLPVALMGKVYCKVDADTAPIAVGDLLTTSAIPGHAMKACDPLRAFGTVIGKALKSLSQGQGLIPILIALQ